jgi:hypothetical protein
VGYWQNRRADAPPRSERARTLTARSDITAVLAAGDPTTLSRPYTTCTTTTRRHCR